MTANFFFLGSLDNNVNMATDSHTVAIITGANRGFGRAIAHALTRCSAENERLSLILVGRDAAGLETVKEEVKQMGAEGWNIVGSLENIKEVEELWEIVAWALESVQKDGRPITRAYLINNAGSTGPLEKRVGEYDIQEISNYITFNISSFIGLCSSFIKYFRNGFESSSMPELFIVNISSLLAVQASPYWGLYASAKAARDQLIKVIAHEEVNSKIKALSYAPGPLDNDMQKTVRESIGDAEQKILYTDMFKKNSLVSMDASAYKLIQLLASGKFESGAHVDYYDI